MVKRSIGAAPREGIRVLVCDDESHMARVTRLRLERCGYEVTVVFSGQAAIERLRQVQPLETPGFDFVVIDIDMPIVGGFDVLRWIRASPTFQDLRVILLGAGDDCEMFEANEWGADMYSRSRSIPTN